MPQEPRFLSADQLLLTTLIVKLAVIAVLATMLARYRRFRHILIFERRGWADRILFTLAIAVPLIGGVVVRRLLNYDAADLTLEGAFIAGLIDGPYAGVIVGAMVGLPPLFFGELGAPWFAIGCGFTGGGLRELCPKDVLWQFSPFVFTQIHKRVWQMIRSIKIDWQLVLLLVPIGLELIRQGIGARVGNGHRLFYLSPGPTWSLFWLAVIVLATVLAVATPIKIWNNARIEHRLQEQEKLLLAAKL